MIRTGYVPERPFPKRPYKNRPPIKKKPFMSPNSMIGRFTDVLGTAVLGWPVWDDTEDKTLITVL